MTFEAESWGRRPTIDRKIGDFTDVWSVDAFDAFVTNGIRVPLVRLVRDGSPMAIDEYSGAGRFGGRDVPDAIDSARIADAYASGATVVAQSLHRTHDSVRRFVRTLSTEISHPVQANSYLTPPGSVGLAPHRDAHDVFVIQLAGAKCWHVDGLGDAELAAGDVLYVPAGTRHSAAATTDMSLHLTIGVMRVTYRAVLERLLRNGPGALDDPLPLRYRDDDIDVEQRMESVIDEVVSFLADAEPSEIVERERRRPVQKIPGDGRLTAAVEVGALRLDSWIGACPEPWTVDIATPDRIHVSARNSFVEAPIVCQAAIEQLEADAPTRVDALAGLDEPSRLVFARRLVGAGLCRIVD